MLLPLISCWWLQACWSHGWNGHVGRQPSTVLPERKLKFSHKEDFNTWLSAWSVDAPAISRQVTDHRRRSASLTTTSSPASVALSEPDFWVIDFFGTTCTVSRSISPPHVWAASPMSRFPAPPYILQGSTVIYLKTFGNSCKAIVCWCVIQCVCVCAPSASAIVLYELNFEDSTWSFKFGGRGFMTIIPSSDCQLFAVINILNASEDFDCRSLDNVQTNETKYSPSQCTLALSSVNRFWNNKHKKPVHIKYKTKNCVQ